MPALLPAKPVLSQYQPPRAVAVHTPPGPHPKPRTSCLFSSQYISASPQPGKQICHPHILLNQPSPASFPHPTSSDSTCPSFLSPLETYLEPFLILAALILHPCPTSANTRSHMGLSSLLKPLLQAQIPTLISSLVLITSQIPFLQMLTSWAW